MHGKYLYLIRNCFNKIKMKNNAKSILWKRKKLNWKACSFVEKWGGFEKQKREINFYFFGKLKSFLGLFKNPSIPNHFSFLCSTVQEIKYTKTLCPFIDRLMFLCKHRIVTEKFSYLYVHENLNRFIIKSKSDWHGNWEIECKTHGVNNLCKDDNLILLMMRKEFALKGIKGMKTNLCVNIQHAHYNEKIFMTPPIANNKY